MLTHLLILLAIILVVGGGTRLARAARGTGEGIRNFKKAVKGEGDIDVTDSSKRIEGDDSN